MSTQDGSSLFGEGLVSSGTVQSRVAVHSTGSKSCSLYIPTVSSTSGFRLTAPKVSARNL